MRDAVSPYSRPIHTTNGKPKNRHYRAVNPANSPKCPASLRRNVHLRIKRLFDKQGLSEERERCDTAQTAKAPHPNDHPPRNPFPAKSNGSLRDLWVPQRLLRDPI